MRYLDQLPREQWTGLCEDGGLGMAGLFGGDRIVATGGCEVTVLAGFHTAAELDVYEEGSPGGGLRGCLRWGVWVGFGRGV
jgi:hypothetical protein